MNTSTATLAAIEENERRFKEQMRILNLPYHRTYLDATTSGVPRSRSLVRLSDTPIFAMYWWFFTHQNWRCPSFIVYRIPPIVVIRDVRASGDWVGTYGSAS